MRLNIPSQSKIGNKQRKSSKYVIADNSLVLDKLLHGGVGDCNEHSNITKRCLANVVFYQP